MAGPVHLAAPGDGGRTRIPVAERLVVGERGGDPVLVHLRLQLLGAAQIAPTDLGREVWDWIPGQASRDAIERRLLDVVAVLVGFATAKVGHITLAVMQHIAGG